MEKRYRSYIYKLGVISIVLLIGSVTLFLTVLETWFNYIFPFVILYFFLFNSIQHFKLLKVSKGDPRIFHTNYMAWFGIKMFLNLSFVLIYALLNKAQAVSFILFFTFCYVV
ncbi:MAG: hypothetical protein N4A59_13430, partial [Marinifilum sp.]|nr:hypothetical protein [Marinifilum sp.]